MKYKIRQSKKGRIMHSEATGNTYLVHKWKEYENGNVVAINKELIENKL